jgi:hypothetical protein
MTYNDLMDPDFADAYWESMKANIGIIPSSERQEHVIFADYGKVCGYFFSFRAPKYSNGLKLSDYLNIQSNDVQWFAYQTIEVGK